MQDLIAALLLQQIMGRQGLAMPMTGQALPGLVPPVPAAPVFVDEAAREALRQASASIAHLAQRVAALEAAQRSASPEPSSPA